MYTAEPAVAVIAPIDHMVNAIPTLLADLKITLGVAKILSIRKSTPAENERRENRGWPGTNQLVKGERNDAG